jgi:secreted PhoX family phosphatase
LQFNSPDNLAVDHENNIYIVEDREAPSTTTSGLRSI